MKVFRVIDDGTEVMATVNELEALRLLRRLCDKHDVMAAWVDDCEVK